MKKIISKIRNAPPKPEPINTPEIVRTIHECICRNAKSGVGLWKWEAHGPAHIGNFETAQQAVDASKRFNRILIQCRGCGTYLLSEVP